MNMIPVTSSNLSAVGYDPQTLEMVVSFSYGGSYLYPGVRADEHEALMSAESIGKHFNSQFRNREGTRKLDRP